MPLTKEPLDTEFRTRDPREPRVRQAEELIIDLHAEIERLEKCLKSRDDFLVSRDLFSDYTATLTK